MRVPGMGMGSVTAMVTAMASSGCAEERAQRRPDWR